MTRRLSEVFDIAYLDAASHEHAFHCNVRYSGMPGEQYKSRYVTMTFSEYTNEIHLQSANLQAANLSSTALAPGLSHQL